MNDLGWMLLLLDDEDDDLDPSEDMTVLTADTPEDIDSWPSLARLFGMEDEDVAGTAQ